MNPGYDKRPDHEPRIDAAGAILVPIVLLAAAASVGWLFA